MSKISPNPALYKPGDPLRSHQGVVREIVDVRPTGYGRKYPDLGAITPSGEENYFWWRLTRRTALPATGQA